MMEGCLKRGAMVVMDEGCSGCLGVALHFKDCMCLSSVSNIVGYKRRRGQRVLVPGGVCI